MNLGRRLAKLEGDVRPVPVPVTYDLRLLHPADIDFICRFRFRPQDDQEFLDNLPDIEALLRHCQVEPIESYLVIFPEFPRDLQTHWRHLCFLDDQLGLPRGNYDFQNLSYVEQAEFETRCARYGWDPDVDDVEIDALTRWSRDDLLVIYDLLEKALPYNEKAMRQRRQRRNDEEAWG